MQCSTKGCTSEGHSVLLALGNVSEEILIGGAAYTSIRLCSPCQTNIFKADHRILIGTEDMYISDLEVAIPAVIPNG